MLSGNYNENRYNRTLWYAVTDAGYKLFPSSCLNSKIDSPNRESRFDKFGKCKTDINTDNKPDSKPDNPPVVINNDTPQGDGAKALTKWYNALHTDSAEYKMWGNGIALPCAAFVLGNVAKHFPA